MKRILLIHPNNFLAGGQGENNRVLALTKMLKQLDFQIDLFSFENFSQDSTFANYEGLNKHNLVNKLFVYDFQSGYEKNGVFSKGKLLYGRIKEKLGRHARREQLQNWIPAGAQRLFDDILKENEYDVVAMFYTYTANLFKERKISAKKVYFMEDSMFLQQFSWDKASGKNMTLGKLLDEELERLNYFDEYFCISYDEKIMYEKLVGRYMHFLPHLLEKTKKCEIPVNERRWDVFFIGFNNPFNVEGLNWFLQDVYPLLNDDIRILLVGAATKQIKVTYKNVDIIAFAPDLDEIFSQVKMAICPMFRGTGMKVKVVEAMAKGLPVVCNDRGIDGFPDKTMCGCLVTQDAKMFAKYINHLATDNDYYSETVSNINRYYATVLEKGNYQEMLKYTLGANLVGGGEYKCVHF